MTLAYKVYVYCISEGLHFFTIWNFMNIEWKRFALFSDRFHYKNDRCRQWFMVNMVNWSVYGHSGSSYWFKNIYLPSLKGGLRLREVLQWLGCGAESCPKVVSSKPGLAIRQIKNSHIQPSSKWVFVSKLCLPYAVSKILWASNPLQSYGKLPPFTIGGYSEMKEFAF